MGRDRDRDEEISARTWTARGSKLDSAKVVELDETVQARCDEVGITQASPRDPGATILANPATPRAPAETLASAPAPPETARDLPRISVDLRGTLGGSGDEAPRSLSARDIEVLRTLGEGGMGRVFLARQHSLDREVAIKTVRDSASEKDRVALLAEGAITGRLEHPGVIPVHALGLDEEGRPALVMKRVEGASWSELLADPDHPAWRERGGAARDRLDAHLEILMQVCNAVHFAHSQGVLHRDIKPANVLLGRYGEVYLADWGIALKNKKEARGQALCGTPSYMAPEMVVGGDVDERTDVYLLGAVLHCILVGKSRHVAPTVPQTLAAALISDPYDYPESVPKALADLANRATARDPEARPKSAAEVRQGISDYLRHKGSIALAASARERVERLRALEADGQRRVEEAGQRDVDLVAAEARFAIDEALRGWAENEDALRLKDELEAILAARRARLAELERLAHELDPNVSRTQRTAVLVVLTAVGLGLSASAFVTEQRAENTRSIFFQSLVPLAVMVVALVAARKHLLGTAVNRRATAGIAVAIAGIAVHRAIALVSGAPAHQVLLSDCVLCAALAGVAAVYLFRWAAILSAVMLGGAMWIAVSPDQAMRAFSFASGLGLVLMVLLGSRKSSRLRA